MREDEPEDLREARRELARGFTLRFVRLPYDALVHLEVERRERESPAWIDAHYALWGRRDVVKRVLFLQEALRLAKARGAVLGGLVLPVAVFAALVVGLLLGRALPR